MTMVNSHVYIHLQQVKSACAQKGTYANAELS